MGFLLEKTGYPVIYYRFESDWYNLLTFILGKDFWNGRENEKNTEQIQGKDLSPE